MTSPTCCCPSPPRRCAWSTSENRDAHRTAPSVVAGDGRTRPQRLALRAFYNQFPPRQGLLALLAPIDPPRVRVSEGDAAPSAPDITVRHRLLTQREGCVGCSRGIVLGRVQHTDRHRWGPNPVPTPVHTFHSVGGGSAPQQPPTEGRGFPGALPAPGKPQSRGTLRTVPHLVARTVAWGTTVRGTRGVAPPTRFVLALSSVTTTDRLQSPILDILPPGRAAVVHRVPCSSTRTNRPPNWVSSRQLALRNCTATSSDLCTDSTKRDRTALSVGEGSGSGRSTPTLSHVPPKGSTRLGPVSRWWLHARCTP